MAPVRRVPSLTDHDGASLGVDGQVLSRHQSPAAALAERLHVDPVKQVLTRVVLEDDDTARVRAHDHIVCQRRVGVARSERFGAGSILGSNLLWRR